MCRQYRIALAISFGTAICLFSGCGAEVAPLAVKQNPTGNKIASRKIAIEQEVDTAEQLAKKASSTDKASEDAQLQQVGDKPGIQAYEPPFPDRVDLFMVPKREGRGIAVTPEGLEKAVELIGFVNVDAQQVVLTIDGVVTPLEVGSKVAEIEVISIQPPTVVLQRGRQRWQAALEN